MNENLPTEASKRAFFWFICCYSKSRGICHIFLFIHFLACVLLLTSQRAHFRLSCDKNFIKNRRIPRPIESSTSTFLSLFSFNIKNSFLSFPNHSVYHVHTFCSLFPFQNLSLSQVNFEIKRRSDIHCRLKF